MTFRRRPPRALTEEERVLWDYVTRHDLQLPPAPAKPKAKSPPVAATSPKRSSFPKPPVAPPLREGNYAGVDKKSARALKRGKRLIEARLDLHGYSREQAFEALSRFITKARDEEKRVVLVITGHGRRGGSEAGVLREALPRWLETAPLRAHILAFDTAQPKDGGLGAFYILLRRVRMKEGDRGNTAHPRRR